MQHLDLTLTSEIVPLKQHSSTKIVQFIFWPYRQQHNKVLALSYNYNKCIFTKNFTINLYD